jgi:hypothetical protein
MTRAEPATISAILVASLAGTTSCTGLIGADTPIEIFPVDSGTRADGDGDAGTADSSSTYTAVSESVSCEAGLTACGGTCSNLQTDGDNCGGCGLPCPTGCSAGRCVVTLASGPHASAIAVDAANV